MSKTTLTRKHYVVTMTAGDWRVWSGAMRDAIYGMASERVVRALRLAVLRIERVTDSRPEGEPVAVRLTSGDLVYGTKRAVLGTGPVWDRIISTLQDTVRAADAA